MKVSPKLIGKVIGGIIGIGICVSTFLWLRSTYSIKGTIQIDTGVDVRAARQKEVILIQGFVKEDLEQLVAEYNSFEKQQTEKIFDQLLKKYQETLDAKKLDSKVEVKPEKKREILDIETDEAENATIKHRMHEYAGNAVYCREEIPDINKGQEYYEYGALFWEEKISNLKDFDRLVVDEASLNYETIWRLAGGLGTEPIQIVKAIIRTNIIKRTAGEINIPDKSEEMPKEKAFPDKPKINEVVPGGLLTKEEVMNFAVELNRELESEYKVIADKSSDLILAMSIEYKKTDDFGNFDFKDKVVQPGNFIIYSKFDILSVEGEPVEFMWFNPINIPANRLAFDKTTIFNLDELNQTLPPYLEIYIPEKEELFLRFVDRLILKIKN